MTNRLDDFAYTQDLVQEQRRRGITQEIICGTCKWHSKQRISGEWTCGNSISDRYSDETEYVDGCQDWEGR